MRIRQIILSVGLALFCVLTVNGCYAPQQQKETLRQHFENMPGGVFSDEAQSEAQKILLKRIAPYENLTGDLDDLYWKQSRIGGNRQNDERCDSTDPEAKSEEECFVVSGVLAHEVGWCFQLTFNQYEEVFRKFPCNFPRLKD